LDVIRNKYFVQLLLLKSGCYNKIQLFNESYISLRINLHFYFFDPNYALDKYGIDVRLVINGFCKPLITSRTSGLTLIISTIRFFKTYTAEMGFKTKQMESFSIKILN